jgi:hypothetical protein
VKSFAHGLIVHPVVIVLRVIVLRCQSPTSCGVRNHLFLSIYLESRLLADGHLVHLVVIVLDAITLVLVLQDAMILVIALHALTMLEVDLQNVIGVEFELHGMTVAVGTLRDTNVLPGITIPIHLAEDTTLCLRNVDPLMIVAAVVILLLELNSLAMCLYPPAVLLLPFPKQRRKDGLPILRTNLPEYEQS